MTIINSLNGSVQVNGASVPPSNYTVQKNGNNILIKNVNDTNSILVNDIYSDIEINGNIYSNINDTFNALTSGSVFYMNGGGSGHSIPAGTYNATTGLTSAGFPLNDGVGTVGSYYIVNVGGTQNLGSGDITFVEGNWVQYSQSLVWVKIVIGAGLVSFNGRTNPVVTPQAGDYTATLVGLGNVPNTNATDLSNDLIAGTFTPSNTQIITGDSGKIAFEKTQGQINNKANAVPENVSEIYVDLLNGSNTQENPSIIEPFLTLVSALSKSTYNTTGAVFHISKGTVPATTINSPIGTDGMTIIGQGNPEDTLLESFNLNSASGNARFSNVTLNNAVIRASTVSLTNCKITGTFTILNNNNLVIFKQVDYSSLINSNFIFTESTTLISTLSIGTDCIGIDNISNASNFVTIKNKISNETNTGLMSNIQAQKLLYTDSNQWLDRVPNGGTIPIYEKHLTSANQVVGKEIFFPNYEVPVDGDDFDGDIIVITATPSANTPYPTTEIVRLKAQGGTLINFNGTNGTFLDIEEGTMYSGVYRKLAPNGTLINTIFIQ